MNYELAKELKDKGYKFKRPREMVTELFEDDDTQEVHVKPTLSELIEACGYGFAALARVGDLYYVNEGFESETPEGAVANLWLALNKK